MTRLIDYTRTYWGHNFEIFQDYGEGQYKISAFASRRPRIGDLVRWKTEYGYCDLSITEIRYERDPMDMYWATVTVTTRYNDKGEVIG